MAHGEIYDAEFGWDSDFEALVARIVADYSDGHDPQREAAWIAELAGRRVGCVFCVADPQDRTAAKLRILLVHPDARGHGLGGRLVDNCLLFARGAGYERMRLWTNHPLQAARRIYLSRGVSTHRRARAPLVRRRPRRSDLRARPRRAHSEAIGTPREHDTGVES